MVHANFQITSDSDTYRRSQQLRTMDEIQTLIFDPVFDDSSTSCSEEDSSLDDSDSEYDLSDPEVGMNQNSSDSESRCSELEDELLEIHFQVQITLLHLITKMWQKYRKRE